MFDPVSVPLNRLSQVVDNGKRLLAAGKLEDPALQQLLHVAADDRGGYGGSPELARLDPRMDHV